MKAFRSKEGYLLRLERGEEIHESFVRFAEEHGLKGGVVQGLGAVENAELGYYDLDRRAYDRREVPERTEILSLNGNLCRRDGKPFLHAHVILMREDGSLVGGHLFRGTVSVTGEFAIGQTDLDLVRLPDPGVGLSLLAEGPGE
jgi:hypothetical protein